VFVYWTIRKLRQLGVPWSVIGWLLLIAFGFFLLAIALAAS